MEEASHDFLWRVHAHCPAAGQVGIFDEFQVAYEDTLARTSTRMAPWYVVPSNHKWYRNWAVSRILIDTLTRMDPHYPS